MRTSGLDLRGGIAWTLSGSTLLLSRDGSRFVAPVLDSVLEVSRQIPRQRLIWCELTIFQAARTEKMGAEELGAGEVGAGEVGVVECGAGEVSGKAWRSGRPCDGTGKRVRLRRRVFEARRSE